MHEHDAFDPDFLCALAGATSEDDVFMTEPMKAHTTFGIGGAADVLVTPRSRMALARVLDICAIAGSPTVVVGNGSNLLVADRGVRGTVVLVRDNLAGIEVDAAHRCVRADAGALLRDVAVAAAEAGLSGLEPLWGIPATVGGACFMNAGAYGSTTGEVLASAEVYVPGRACGDGTRAKGSVCTLEADELKMGYRCSRVHDEGLVVLGASFALEPDEPSAIRARMDDYRRRREEKQPLDLPSAGSTFKRPQGYFAGKLIQDAGLSGVRVGGAQVSPKHCGFVVNTGGATARDVRGLIKLVQDEVRARFGVELEPEVRMVGEF